MKLGILTLAILAMAGCTTARTAKVRYGKMNSLRFAEAVEQPGVSWDRLGNFTRAAAARDCKASSAKAEIQATVKATASNPPKITTFYTCAGALAEGREVSSAAKAAASR